MVFQWADSNSSMERKADVFTVNTFIFFQMNMPSWVLSSYKRS